MNPMKIVSEHPAIRGTWKSSSKRKVKFLYPVSLTTKKSAQTRVGIWVCFSDLYKRPERVTTWVTSLLADETVCLINQWLCPIGRYGLDVNEWNETTWGSSSQFCSGGRMLTSIFWVYWPLRRERDWELNIHSLVETQKNWWQRHLGKSYTECDNICIWCECSWKGPIKKCL